MSFVVLISSLLLVFFISFVQNDVNVTDSGVIPWKKGDYAITFYVTLNNFGNRPVTVNAEMIKCCEQNDDTDFNCDHFKLIGSNIDLEARRIKNITLLYLNIYSYNRRGKCDIRINVKFNNIEQSESTIVKEIYFDTSLTRRESSYNWLLDKMKNNKIKCDSPDEDPLDFCLPVNCHMKYSGYRGFYNTSTKKCVQIPRCKSDIINKQAYLWFSNQCVNLNNTVSQKDIQEVLYRINNDKSSELHQSQTIDTMDPSQKIRCHHGYMNNLTDLCECDFGWESEKDLNWDNFIPSTVPFHMCTVRKNEIPENYFKFLKKLLLPENWTTSELVSFCTIFVLMFNILPIRSFKILYYNV